MEASELATVVTFKDLGVIKECYPPLKLVDITKKDGTVVRRYINMFTRLQLGFWLEGDSFPSV